MKLNFYKLKSSSRSESTTRNWSIRPYSSPAQQYQPDTWVEVLEPPSCFCSDTALLLCQESADQWLAWIPDYGEIKLYAHQFRKAS